MPDHVTRVKEGKTHNRRTYWVALCTCGWNSRSHSQHHEAMKAADDHLWLATH